MTLYVVSEHPGAQQRPEHKSYPLAQVAVVFQSADLLFHIFAIMTLPTLLLVVVTLGAYALYKYLDISRRHRILRGSKPLPGPKGMAFHHGQALYSAINPDINKHLY